MVKKDGIRVDDLDQINIPDPVAQEFARLREEIGTLKEKVDKLEER